MRMLCAALLALLSFPAWAQKSVKADLDCGVFNKKDEVEYIVPTEDGRKLTRTFECALDLSVEVKGALTAHLWLQTAEGEGEHHTGPITKADGLDAEFKPGTDFQPCTDFEIHGRIEGKSGTLWEATQQVTQKCTAKGPAAAKPGKPVKAKFGCKKVLKDQSKWAIGTEGYKIDAERIDCTLSTKEARAQGSTASIRTVWHKGSAAQPGRDRLGEPNSEEGFQWFFTLEKGTDWDVCATDLLIPVTLTDPNGQVIFQAQEKYLQDCAPVPVAPPVGSVPPTTASASWESGALERIPEAGRTAAQLFIDAAVDSDPPALASMGAKGVKVGKKVLKGKDLFDLAATGIKPLVGCDQGDCKWGPWSSQVKGPGEFWIFSQNESGYGSFACAVFTKSGAEWRWTAVRTYETGEP